MFNLSGIQEQLSIMMVFVEGLISFFSPCVIPLLPVYMGYLASSQKQETKSQRKVFFLTLFFVLGLFTAILLFHFAISLLQAFTQDATIWITRIAGICIIIMGVYQLGFFKIGFMEKTRQFKWKNRNMNAGAAFLLGFIFSFAWTPCIGPALTSILLFAGSAETFLNGTFYVLIYALGFGIPFLLLGAFTQRFLKWISANKQIMKYTVKAGAIIMMIIGFMMLMNSFQMNATSTSSADKATAKASKSLSFALSDINGNTVSIKDLQGKVVFINFWQTWCDACKEELPHVQSLYEKYKDSEDVAIITIVNLQAEENGKQGVLQYVQKQTLNFPVLIDSGEVSRSFGISAYPTTFMLDKQGEVFGYVKGALTQEMMESIISQTLEGKKAQ